MSERDDYAKKVRDTVRYLNGMLKEKRSFTWYEMLQIARQIPNMLWDPIPDIYTGCGWVIIVTPGDIMGTKVEFVRGKWTRFPDPDAVYEILVMCDRGDDEPVE